MNSGNSCTNLCARGRTQHCWGTAQSTVMAEPTALCRAGKPPPIPPHPHCVPCSSTAHVDVLHPTVLFQQKVQLHVPSPGCYLPSTSCMPASRCFKYIYIYIFFFPKQSICATEELNLNTRVFIISNTEKKDRKGREGH